MATIELPPRPLDAQPPEPISVGPASVPVGRVLYRLVEAVASLKLTVVLFALSIFLILAGTFAQVDYDIWEVIDLYFRTPVAWIPFQVFLPRTWNTADIQIPGGIYFPGGYLIAGAMAANLLAAHCIRFQIAARGARLVWGLVVTALGALVTWAVIALASNAEGLQGEPVIPYGQMWLVLKHSLGLGWLGWGVWHGMSLAGQSFAKLGWLTKTSLGAWAGVGCVVVWLFTAGSNFALGDSSMRILWQLAQGGGAAGILLAGCALLFEKRAGVVLLHGGIGLMMIGELVVALTATESQLHMREGETVDFTQDIRSIEFAVIDPSDPVTDSVTVLPKNLFLRAVDNYDPRPVWQRAFPRSTVKAATIDLPQLPFTFEVVKYFPNSTIRKAGPQEPNLATAGEGKEWIAEEKRISTGTDSDSKVDLPAAYVKLTSRDGRDLGTHLVGAAISSEEIPEVVDVDGKTYHVALRFRRHHKPYEMTLKDVRKDDYLGTNTPRNYSSDVKLVDASRNVERDVHIWMNNPLRFAGETFYQSSYHRDPKTGAEYTTLQVVTNTGWMIPYVSCMIVAVGMLAHFTLTLLRFARRLQEEHVRSQTAFTVEEPPSDPRRRAAKPAAGALAKPDSAPIPTWLRLGVPLAGAAFAGSFVLSGWPKAGAKDGAFDVHAFGQLPVVANGRAKPFDSLARSTMLSISNRDVFYDAEKKSHPAIEFLLDAMARPPKALEHRVFKIDNLEVLDLLGLARREHFRYAYNEFGAKLDQLMEQAEKAREVRQKTPEKLSIYQRKVLELEHRIGQFDVIVQAFSPPEIGDENPMRDLQTAVMRLNRLEQTREPPLAIPPSEDEKDWQLFSMSWLKSLVSGSIGKERKDGPVEKFTSILVAYAKQDPAAFNQAVAGYKASLEKQTLKEVNLASVSFEAFFNRLQPFTLAFRLYVMGFAVAFIGWLGMTSRGWMTSWQRAALLVVLVAFALHSYAIVSRIYISGRPPVTNLYGAAVFVGWGVALLALGLDSVARVGFGSILAGVAGASTLVVASYLGNDGDDTLKVLQAVLDTQFWLSTHVTCITFGYSTTYLAGALGALYIILGVLTPALSSTMGKEIARMTYGALCFSILFSFVGTVLGGLWADDSWGRFWGWDPKENGALMIVLWNALVLHARWGGMIKERGIAVLSVFGNIVVSWSFFGVNELGVGLHAYGFREGMLYNLGLFALSQLVLIALGCLPVRYWFSGRSLGTSTAS